MECLDWALGTYIEQRRLQLLDTSDRYKVHTMVLSIQRSKTFNRESNYSNRLLSLLPESKLQNLLIYSDRITLPAKTNLDRTDETIERVYFPLHGIISLVNIDEDGLISEVAGVSNEGAIGIGGFLGGNISTSQAIAQTDCIAISVPANILRRQFARGEELQRILLLYTQALLTQISQNVLCSCHHTIEQRLVRWLLFYSDRLNSKTILLTQETLADLLGVRRSSLSIVAVNLRQRKLINYNRGKITLLNFNTLRQLSCRCDRLIADEYSRLLNL